MLKIGEKTFMNLQEAVGWLLDNNSIPFQCTANYAANTEIGLGTIVNPTPAKVKIGSLIFFADSKVSTVTGITENGFICSNEYNNLVDDVAHVTGVAINASGHLITTMSDGQTIDAGLIKQVSSFSINASQHLIANFNDGTSNDLGAIFSGNVNIAGNFTADSIIENMSGYEATLYTNPNVTIENVYCGAVKNGNKLTLVMSLALTRTDSATFVDLARFDFPTVIGARLSPAFSDVLEFKDLTAGESSLVDNKTITVYITKVTNGRVKFIARSLNSLDLNKKYYVRYEATFLLSDNIAS